MARGGNRVLQSGYRPCAAFAATNADASGRGTCGCCCCRREDAGGRCWRCRHSRWWWCQRAYWGWRCGAPDEEHAISRAVETWVAWGEHKRWRERARYLRLLLL